MNSQCAPSPIAPTMRRHSCSSTFLTARASIIARHAVGPVDLLVLEDLDHVDVDEIHAELGASDAGFFHFLLDRVGEFLDLLRRGGTGRALDPGVRPAHVVLRYPRRMTFDLEADVALLEEHGLVVAAQHGVAQSGLEAVPARREGARDVADVLVVHQQHRAQAMRLHLLARPLQAVVAHALPVDALLPVQSCYSEIRHVFSPVRESKYFEKIKDLAADKMSLLPMGRHSVGMFASLITFPKRSVSALMTALNSAGVLLVTIVIPLSPMRLTTKASFIICTPTW